MDTSSSAKPPTPKHPSPPHPSQGGGSVKLSNPRVLIVRGVDSPLSNLSPFQRKEACDRLGKIARCDVLKDGSLELEFDDSREAGRALNITELSYTRRENGVRRLSKVKVTFETHKTKNTCRGVIRCFELKGVSEEDIVDGLEEFGVVGAKRVRTKRGGEEKDTDTIILTFDGLDLPDKVSVGYTKVNVRAYIPNPMRCFTCHRYGHTTASCRGTRTCGKCGASDHVAVDCTAPQHFCVNCGEGQVPHTVFDKNCPILVKEREIMNLKVKNRLSFREARDVYERAHPKKSYAQAVGTGVPASSTPRMTPEEVIRSLTVADLVRLAGRMGLVFANQPAAPAPEPLAAPPPRPPSVGGGGRDAAPAPIPSPQATAGDGGRESPPVPERQPAAPAADTRESAPGATPSDAQTGVYEWATAGRGGKHSPTGMRRPRSPVLPPTGGGATSPPAPDTEPVTEPPAQTTSLTVAAMRKNFESARGRSPVKRPAGSPPGQHQTSSRPRNLSAETARGRSSVRNRLGGPTAGPAKGAGSTAGSAKGAGPTAGPAKGAGPPWKG